MLYEVLIPSSEPGGFDERLTVDADNWMVALKSGLEQTGEEHADIRNVMCDIKENNTIHVTDALTRRVFVLRELDAELDDEIEQLRQQAERAKKEAPEPAPIHEEPFVDAPTLPVDAASIAEADSWVSDDGKMRVRSATQDKFGASKSATVVRRERRPSVERASVQIGRTEAETAISQNIIEDIFLEIQAIHERNMAMEEAVDFIIEMAMEKVPAESGAILFADVDGSQLYFAAARGPKASNVMDFKVPMGQGIVGFCAREGVAIAISDAQRDPRFFRGISDALKYPTESIICAPIQFEGRVYGCVELINRKSGSTFTANEANALQYIGTQFAEYINRLIMSREKI